MCMSSVLRSLSVVEQFFQLCDTSLLTIEVSNGFATSRDTTLSLVSAALSFKEGDGAQPVRNTEVVVTCLRSLYWLPLNSSFAL